MTAGFQEVIQHIDRVLDTNELDVAATLLMSAPEAASDEGMIIDPSGEVLGLRGKRQVGPFEPSAVLDLGLAVAVLIEDSGYKLGKSHFVRSGAQYADMLCRYADQAITSRESRFKILKKHLMLQVRSGTYRSAACVADAAQKAVDGRNDLEATTMSFNLGSIHLRLNKPAEACAYYESALDKAKGCGAPRNVITMIHTNLKGIDTGYDPDFMFLPG